MGPNLYVAQNSFTPNYKPLFGLKKNIHILISKDDPYCDVDQIYKNLAKLSKKHVAVHILSGDHNFKLTNSSSKLNEENAIRSSLNWLSLQM